MRSSIVVTFARYSAGGIVNTVFAYSLIFVLMYAINLSPERSNILAYCVSVFSSFYLNKMYIFRSKGRTQRELPLFLMVSSSCFICSFVSLKIAISSWGVNPYIAQLLAGGVYVGTSFLLHLLAVFRRGNIRIAN
jgi:putative flippase GtrA